MTTMTIHLYPALEERLSRLAQDTNRNESSLAADAIGNYVDHQLEVITGINQKLLILSLEE